MKSFNKVELKGRIHSYALEVKDTDNGEAIVGTVSLEVDEKGTVIESRFFAKPTYSSGKPNRTYTFLDDLMAGNYKTIKNDADEADWLSIDATVSPDYFVGRDGAKTIEDLNSSQKIRGSFINANKSHDYANSWKCDMLITRVEEIEPDEEKHIKHKARIHGYIIDDYNERVMGVKFDALDEAPMNYVLGLETSHDQPFYTSVKGEFRKETTLITREGAFGNDETVEYDNIRWALTWMPRNPYLFGEDITEDEYKNLCNGLDEYREEKLNKNKSAEDEKDKLVF